MEGEEERPERGEEQKPPQAKEQKPPLAEEQSLAPGEEERPARGPEEQETRGPGATRYLATAAIAAGVLLFALAFFMAGLAAYALLDEDDGGGGSSTGSDTNTGGVAEHDPAWGPEDAAVVVQEFADFQCPYCGKFALQTLPQLREAYGEEVRFVFRDFPLSAIHGSAQKAAEAAQCAQDQGVFWEYHDLLFANQDAIGESDLRAYAEDAGADMDEFNDCLDSGKNRREVLLDMQDGRRAGVDGTPAFLVNDMLMSGAQPFEQFKLAIDQALALAGD